MSYDGGRGVTWPTDLNMDSYVSINGLKLLHGDQNVQSRNSIGGGVCIHVDENCCHPNNVTKTLHLCSPKIEIDTVSLHPHYLPREYSHVIVHTVYVPHRNLAKAAMSELLDRLESSAPHVLTIINDDFNECNPKKRSEYLYQHIDCLTHGAATIDLLTQMLKILTNPSSFPNWRRLITTLT